MAILACVHITEEVDPVWLGLCSVGLALCMMTAGTFDTIAAMWVTAASFGVRISSSALSGGFGILFACVVLAIVVWRRQAAPQVTLAWALAAAFMQVVAVIALYMGSTGMWDAWVAEFMGLVLGALSTLVMALYAQLLAPRGRNVALTVLAVALIIDTLLNLIARNALVDEANVGLVVLAGVCSPMALWALGRLGADGAGNEGGTGSAGGAKGAGTAAGNARAMRAAGMPRAGAQVASVAAPVRRRPLSAYDIPFGLAAVCIAVYGFSMGQVQSLGNAETVVTMSGFLATNSATIGATISALLILGLVRLGNPHAIVRVFILVALISTLYISAVLGDVTAGAAMLAMTVARLAIVTYIWLLACDVPWGHGWPAFAFAIGWGAFTAANTLSTKLGLFVFGERSGWLVAYSLLIMACLVALVLVEVLPQRLGLSLVSGFDPMRATYGMYARFGFERVGDGDEDALRGAGCADSDAAGGGGVGEGVRAGSAAGVPGVDPLVLRCETLARVYGLTARELEVLVPLVRGRSAATIATALCMSVETARTHIRHIYQKTDIHSREELMDVVEALEG